MLRLIYTSVQMPGFDHQAFRRLCEQSSCDNKALGVTGLLLSNGVEFMQCLEGTQEAVTSVYKKIVQDPRHFDIRLLVSEPNQNVLFQQWAMVGLATRLPVALNADPVAYALLDHRLYRPWRSLGVGAVDLIYEYARVKTELEKAGEVVQLSDQSTMMYGV